MATRGSLRKEAALLQKSIMSSRPITPVHASHVTGKRKRNGNSGKSEKKLKLESTELPHGLGWKPEEVDESVALSTRPPSNKKIKTETSGTADSVISELARENLTKTGGETVGTAKKEKEVKSGDAVKTESGVKNEKGVKQEGEDVKDVTPTSERTASLRKKAVVVKQEVSDEDEEEEFKVAKSKSKRASNQRSTPSKSVTDKSDKVVESPHVVKKAPKEKAHPYGLTPGRSPFPDFTMPTNEACHEVARLLTAHHDPGKTGRYNPPAEVPPPSLKIAGCGQTPDVLDAIMRTLLSANTSKRNSSLALAGLNSAFGVRTSGTGKGSIKWEAVQEASPKQIEQAIKRGGLAGVKSANMKKILDTIYAENCARRDALIKEKETGKPVEVTGASHESQDAKDTEIAACEDNLLSMQYILEMTNDEAMNEMTRLPGIGVKTASCVILFSLQRPSFAVDTHVFRLCQLLGWVPEKGATRDKTFSHLEVRVPNELKYALHRLFFDHGNKCGRCKAKGSAEAYENANCPIDHLVTRKTRKVPAMKAKKQVDTDEDEDEDSEEMMSE